MIGTNYIFLYSNLPRQIDIKSPVAEARNEYTYSATVLARVCDPCP